MLHTDLDVSVKFSVTVSTLVGGVGGGGVTTQASDDRARLASKCTCLCIRPHRECVHLLARVPAAALQPAAAGAGPGAAGGRAPAVGGSAASAAASSPGDSSWPLTLEPIQGGKN